MFGSFVSRMAALIGAFAIAASVVGAPLTASAATLPTDHQIDEQVLTLKPDIVVTGTEAKLVNGKVWYMFQYKNIGNFKAKGVTLMKQTEVHHFDGTFAWYDTENVSVPDLEPGQSRTAMVECRWPKGTTHYCIAGFLKVSVTQGASDSNPNNNLGAVGVDSRTV